MKIAIKSNSTVKIYNGDTNYFNLCDFIKKQFMLSPSKYTLTYVDEDGDHITLASTEDMTSAYELNSDKPLLKVILTMTDTREDEKEVFEIINETPVVQQQMKQDSKKPEEPQTAKECWGWWGRNRSKSRSPSDFQYRQPWSQRPFGHGPHGPFGSFGHGPHGPPPAFMPFEPHGPFKPFDHHGPRGHHGHHGAFGHPGHHGSERFGMFQQIMSMTIAEKVDQRVKTLIPCIKTQLEGGSGIKTFSVQNSSVHENTECKSCLASPIVGIRYKCLECYSFSLCEKCEPIVHHEHNLLKMKYVCQQQNPSPFQFPCKFFKKFWKHGGFGRRSHSSSSEKCGKEEKITRKLARIFGGQPKKYEEFANANKSLNQCEVINKYAKDNGEEDKLVNFRCEKIARKLDASPEEFKDFVKSNMDLRPCEIVHKLRESGFESTKKCRKSQDKYQRKCEKKWEKEEKKCRRSPDRKNKALGSSQRTEKGIILETLISLFGAHNVKEYYKLIEQHFSKGQEAIINLWLETHSQPSA